MKSDGTFICFCCEKAQKRFWNFSSYGAILSEIFILYVSDFQLMVQSRR